MMHSYALSIAMLAVFALMAGALYLLFAALVIAANVAIWAMPVPGLG
jgi:hypothetical protein